MPPLSFYTFQNQIPVAGYSWVSGWEPAPREIYDGPRGGSPHLVRTAQLSVDGAFEVKTTSPLTDAPGLYRKFSAMKNDQAEMLTFANLYGWLLTSEFCIHPQTGRPIAVSSAAVWSSELHAMKFAQHLWSAIQLGKHREAGKFIHWAPNEYAVRFWFCVTADGTISAKPSNLEDGPRQVEPSYGYWLIRSSDSEKEMRSLGPGASWTHGDVLGPARLAVSRLINERLEKYCHPRLYLGEDGRHVGLITPRNLLGCLWLQFYQDVAGLQKLRQCAICHEEMDVTENRSHKIVHSRCSANERTRRHREKSKKAPGTG